MSARECAFADGHEPMMVEDGEPLFIEGMKVRGICVCRRCGVLYAPDAIEQEHVAPSGGDGSFYVDIPAPVVATGRVTVQPVVTVGGERSAPSGGESQGPKAEGAPSLLEALRRWRVVPRRRSIVPSDEEHAAMIGVTKALDGPAGDALLALLEAIDEHRDSITCLVDFFGDNHVDAPLRTATGRFLRAMGGPQKGGA